MKLKVLFVAAEVAPIAKVGGLADVIGSLPSALGQFGIEAIVALPFYDFLKKDPKNLSHKILSFNVKFAGKEQIVNVYKRKLVKPSLTLYLYEWFHSPLSEVYGSANMSRGLYVNPLVDLERFIFFSQAVVSSLDRLPRKFALVHCHDWHTALIPYLLKSQRINTPTLLTIHNLANQGLIDNTINKWLPVPISGDEKNGMQYNLLALGIKHADRVNTVSQTYAKEILTKEYGCKLESLLDSYKDKLSGIVNGIDDGVYNPQTDKFIYKRYSINSLHDKAVNKFALQTKLGLKVDAAIPLVGLVSRFVQQKGLSLLTEKVFKLPAQFVLLGEGDEKIEAKLAKFAEKHQNLKIIKGFDLKMAQNIYAGSDFFLMPSNFEPCGLGQLIAMRYGTLPIVRMTGGLKDTVNSKVGFSFVDFRPEVLYKTLERALTGVYAQPEIMKAMKKEAMKQDFSWSKSAKKYQQLYNKLANIKIKRS